EQRNKMQPAAEDHPERPGIEWHSGIPSLFLQTASGKIFPPLFAALVVVSQHHAVGPVPYPVHEAQRHVVESVFVKVILEQDKTSCHPNGFAKEDRRVLRVMQHIHEEADVEGTIRKWQLHAIKGMALDFATRPDQELNALNGDIWPELQNQAGDGAVAASHV